METKYETKGNTDNTCDNPAFYDLIDKQVLVCVEDLSRYKSSDIVKGILQQVSKGYLKIKGQFGEKKKDKSTNSGKLILIPERKVFYIEEFIE